MILAFDTSNYTTSVAFLGEDTHHSVRKLLEVPPGQLGLRQSDALFQHVKRLPQLMEQLSQVADLSTLKGVGVSTRPREVEGSYMPCFLPGETLAKSIATTLGVPCVSVSHQQGHMAAAAWSIHRLDLLDHPFLAWHLSGGTTELLHVTPQGRNVVAELVGGTTDISAGQLIDRTGKLLGLDFPAGPALDALAGLEKNTLPPFAIKQNGLHFSLSGMENKVQQWVEKGTSPQEVSGFLLDSLAGILKKVTKSAQKELPEGENLPVLFCGGVASSQRLKPQLEGLGQVSLPEFSSDNAMGVAVLAKRLLLD